MKFYSHRQEQGSAMVMTLFCLLIMSTIGMSLVFSIGKDINSSNNELLANQAYYAAESGLEDALHVLRGNRCPTDSTDNCASASLVKNQINLEIASSRGSSNLAADATTYPRLSRWLSYTTQDETGVVVLNPTQSSSHRLSYRLKLERVGKDLQISSTGYAPLGAQRTLRMRLSDSFNVIKDYNLLDIPSLITLLGTNPTGTAGNSAAHSLNGTDCVGLDEKPIVGAVGGSNAQNVWQNSFSGNKTNTFDTNLPISSTTGVVADIATPNPAMKVTGKVPFDNSATKAQEFIDDITQIAHTVVPSGGSLPSGALGSTVSPKVVVVNGDLSLHSGGAGLLIVTGELTLNGNFSYDGLILVLGKGQLRRNGGGNGAIRGGILIGAYTAGSATFDLASSIDTGGGGNSLIQYCSDSIKNAFGALPGFSVKSVSEQ
jgi:MSHA biogenesis protein MshP